MNLDFGPGVNGLASNLGVFGPVAWLGWRVILWQRADLTKERDEARADLKEARQRIDSLTDDVVRTMAAIGTAVRGVKP